MRKIYKDANSFTSITIVSLYINVKQVQGVVVLVVLALTLLNRT